MILESPYAGRVTFNTQYARRCLLDSLGRFEAPIASHLLYTQVLNDMDPLHREAGIAAGLAWAAVCDYAVFCIDHGWSPGMLAARAYYDATGVNYILREIGTPL